MKIFVKLQDLNLGITGFEEFDEFRKVCNDFIRHGKYSNGRIEVSGAKRIICYDFSDEVHCMLKYDETV
tara:strand:- start:688 stop:894 length:207 start_codon:yes stop_codon:yes gene_type:complete